MNDKEDKLLRDLLTAEPVADNGFSRRIVRRLRRQIWVDLLALPLALIVGAALAARPAAQLLEAFIWLLSTKQLAEVQLPGIGLPSIVSAHNVLLAALVFVAGYVSYQILED